MKHIKIFKYKTFDQKFSINNRRIKKQVKIARKMTQTYNILKKKHIFNAALTELEVIIAN